MSTTKTAKATSNKASQNGKAEKSKEQKADKAEMTATVNDFLNPSADARIKKLENFQILAKKHGYLRNKREELDSFIISSDGTKEKIFLTNQDGYSFEVTNTQTIEKVVDVIANELDTFLSRSEKDILQFSI